MGTNHLQVLKALTEACDFCLQQHAMQVKFAEAAIRRIQNLESATRICGGLLDMPDVPEKKALIEQFKALTEKKNGAEDESALFDSLARVESDHEKVEAMLAQVRAYLSEVTGADSSEE